MEGPVALLQDKSPTAVQEKTGDKINQLRSEIIDVASLNQDDPSCQEKALALVSGVEALRQELGIACVTIGVGVNRAILFTHSVKRSADQQIGVNGTPVDMGIFHTKYNEYLFLNGQGVGKLSVVIDQEAELDPNYTVRPPNREGEYRHSISFLQNWAKSNRQDVKRSGYQTEQALRNIISAKDFPKNPNPRDSKYTNRYDNLQLDRLMYEIGQGISQRAEVTDVNFDDMSVLDGFLKGYVLVRATKADFISQAVESHPPETTLPQPTSEEVTHVPTEGSERDTIRKGPKTEELHSISSNLQVYGADADKFKLSDALKLPGDSDKTLLKYYLAQRVLRTHIYNSSHDLSKPATSMIARIPLLGLLVQLEDYIDRHSRKDLANIEEETQKFLEDNYTTEEERYHARTIELAVNDLVARATLRTNYAQVVFTKPLVVEWGERWAQRF